MAGYTRVDTSNNIADGNVIAAADLDNEFDGIQAAFNASTGHNHDGTTGEGAPILVLGPTQDVVVGASTVTPKTTNTVDIGSSSLKFKDLYLAGNASIGGTLGVTGATTLSAALTYGGVTLSNAVTGTGNMVLSASPTLTGTISGANASLSGTLAVTGVATLTAQPILSSLTASRAVFTDGSKGLVSNAITGTGNVVMSASPTLTGTISAEALTTSSTVTLSGGTANGVAYLNGSKVLTTGSALTFDGTGLAVNTASPISGGKFSALADLTAVNGLVLRDSATTYANNDNYVLLQNSTGITVGGLTHPAANSLGVWGNDDIRFLQSAAATEQMRLTSTGLGIGTSSPGTKVEANGRITAKSSDDVNLAFVLNNTASGGREWQLIGSATGGLAGGGIFTLRDNTAGENRLTVSSSGNLGLGVTPKFVNGYTSFEVKDASLGSSGSSDLELSTNAYYNSGWKYINTFAATRYEQYSGYHAWYTAPSGTAGNAITFTQAMTLDASGNLLVGTTSTDPRNFTSGSGYKLGDSFEFANSSTVNVINRTSSGSGTFVGFRVQANGVGTISTDGTSTSYNTSSDYRLKNITGPITTSGAYIDSLNPVEGTWKADGSTFVGLIAHEVQEASRTQVATGVKDGEEMQGMDYSSAEIIANLIAEVKALRQRLAAAGI